MSVTKSVYTEFFLGGTAQAYRFSGQTNSLEVSIANNKLEDTRFQSTGKTFLTGDPESSIKIKGFFDNVASGQLEQEIYETISNSESHYIAALFGTATTGCPAYVLAQAETANMTVSAPIGNLVTIDGDFPTTGSMWRGLRTYQGTISATGTTTYIDIGAIGSNGGYAWLWCYSKTGTITSATVVLQSDDNTGFSSPATEGTFTFSALGGYQVTLSGTVDRYLRLNVTSLGGATDFTVMVVAAVSGVTY